MRGIRALPSLGPQAIRAALQSPHCCRDEGRVPLTAGKGQSKAHCGWILSSAGQLPAPRVLLWLSVGWLWVPGRSVGAERSRGCGAHRYLHPALHRADPAPCRPSPRCLGVQNAWPRAAFLPPLLPHGAAMAALQGRQRCRLTLARRLGGSALPVDKTGAVLSWQLRAEESSNT